MGVATRLLRVTAPKLKGRAFTAGAIFEKSATGLWACVKAAPILYWLVGLPLENIRAFLTGPAKRKGWTYEWVGAWG